MTANTNDLLKKVITVVEIAMTDNRYSVKDHEGKKYSFFTDKQDGQPTKAFKTFQDLFVKNGDIVEISYKDAGKYKNIMWFDRPKDPTQAPPFVEKSEVRVMENQADKKWEKIREEKNDNIKWLNALNNATLLVANGKSGEMKLEEVANWLYNLEPKRGEV